MCQGKFVQIQDFWRENLEQLAQSFPYEHFRQKIQNGCLLKISAKSFKRKPRTKLFFLN